MSAVSFYLLLVPVYYITYRIYSISFQLFRHTLPGHHAGVDRLQLSSDGTQCVSWDTTGHDTSIYLWDIVKGKLSTSVIRAQCWEPGHHAGQRGTMLVQTDYSCLGMVHNV